MTAGENKSVTDWLFDCNLRDKTEIDTQPEVILGLRV
jgi:hypothetical protein